MSIDLKILLIILLLTFAGHLLAYPDLKFAKWGTKKFGDYSAFLFYVWLPLFVYGILWGIYRILIY